MASEINKPTSALAFGVATVSAAGNEANGDAYMIKQWGDHVLIALIDGLGHGEEAAKAAVAAKDYLSEIFYADLELTMSELHERLIKTRGAVIGLTRVDQAEKRFTFCGVGNIEIKVVSDPPMHPMSIGGIVGMSRVHLKKFEYRYNVLNGLAIYSDGVSSRFELPTNELPLTDPQRLAEEILSKCWNKTDDATVIIALEQQTYG